ncbi:hypothetical protein PARPLA_02131 [Rhodobacteraceae bacterium THAF1]|nr:hypothetical protein FIU81_04060 [Palleronia sp. THAF1]VDC25676.1 hypothetical protein PARPLA_02131 [Rhodobacteraceae bacterium THAF1]
MSRPTILDFRPLSEQACGNTYAPNPHEVTR